MSTTPGVARWQTESLPESVRARSAGGRIEGWEELYPYSSRFSEGRREYEEASFWFWDSMHWGSGDDAVGLDGLECAITSLGQFNSRHYRIPPADGIDFRVLYGYPYFSPVTIEDGARIEAPGARSSGAGRSLLRQLGELATTAGSVKVKATSTRSTPSTSRRSRRWSHSTVITSGLGIGRRLGAAGALPPVQGPRPADLAVPLRVPQPRLRRLPRLLRLLQAGVAVDPRPRHRPDGRRCRGRPVPAQRRKQGARPEGRRPLGITDVFEHDDPEDVRAALR